MPLVITAPGIMAQAAADLETIGSALYEAHTLAADSTAAVLPAAADEVSANIAHVFSDYGKEYQQLAGQAAVFHEQFAQHLNVSAGMYAGAEAVNATLLQPLASILNPIIGFEGLPAPLYDLWAPLSYQLGKAVFFDNPLGPYLLAPVGIAAIVFIVVLAVSLLVFFLYILPVLLEAISPTLRALSFSPIFGALTAIA